MVEFSRSEDLERWLKDKPREWSIVIAARAALRVAPVLARTVGLQSGRTGKIARDIVLPTFRAMAAPWFAGNWPNHGGEARAAFAAASRAVGVARAAYATDATAYAAIYVAGAADAAAYAAVAAYATYAAIGSPAAYAADAAAADATGAAVIAATTTATASADILAAASRDARELEAGIAMNRQAKELAAQSLWFGATPRWATENWVKLKFALLTLGEDWEVWIEWYESRLRGNSANQQLELARVMIDEEIWQQGPKVVNAHIKRLMEDHEGREIFRHAISDNPAPPIEPMPLQGPGPQFRANRDGLVDRAPPADLDAGGNDTRTINQLKPLVLRCASELQAHLSRNQFPELLDSAKSYQEALNPANGEIEWGEVWGLGVLLQNAATSAERRIEDRMLPALEDNAKTALDSLLTMHGPMILATRDGARLSEAAAGFSMTKEQQGALRDAAHRVAEQLKASPDVITPRAATSVADAVEAIGQGKHPERGSVYGLATVKNISIVLVGGAAAATPAIIGAFLGAPIVGAVVGAPLSLVVVEAVKKNAAFTALVTQLGAHLETMTDFELRDWLEDRARRLAPFRSFVVKNSESLRKIADATPELKWMLKYIDFIVGEATKEKDRRAADGSRPPDDEPRGGFGSGAFGEGPFGG